MKIRLWSLSDLALKFCFNRFLEAEMNSSIRIDNVDLLPMEKIRLVWKSSQKISNDIKLVEDWISNTHLPTVVQFHFQCATSDVCKQLKNSMKLYPVMFHSLEMEYAINGQKTSRKSLTVKGSDLENSRLWSTMKNMNSSTVYLKSEDIQDLSTEAARSVVATVVTDGDYADTGDELKLREAIEAQLLSFKEEESKFEEVQWDNVFWDPDMIRPDRITSELNHAVSKDETDKSSENSKKKTFGFGFFRAMELGVSGIKGVLGLNAKDEIGANFNYDGRDVTTKVNKYLKETGAELEWTGEKFRVKPMDLYRINTSNMKSTTTIATAYVQVKKFETIYSVKILTDDTLNEVNQTMTPSMIKNQLKKQFDNKMKKIEKDLAGELAEVNKTLDRILKIEQQLESSFERFQNVTTDSVNEIQAKVDADLFEVSRELNFARENFTESIENTEETLRSSFDAKLSYQIENLANATNYSMSQMQSKIDVHFSDLDQDIQMHSTFDIFLEDKINKLTSETRNSTTHIEASIDNNWTQKSLCILQYGTNGCPNGFLDEMYTKATMVKDTETARRGDTEDGKIEVSYLNSTGGGAAWYLVVCCK